MDLKQVRAEISAQIAKLENVLTALDAIGTGPGRGVHKGTGKRRKLSAAARRKIAHAQKVRWAKWRASNKKKAA